MKKVNILGIVAAVALAFVVWLPTARAATIFDLSPTNGTTTSLAMGEGPGQGVSVTTGVTISDFQFFANLPTGGDVKFMIWMQTSTTQSLVHNNTVTFAASSTQSWISSGPISFNLVAGDTYYFGLIANNTELDIGNIYPLMFYTSNGLTALTSGNSNYTNFSSPVLSTSVGIVELGLRLDTGTVSAVPLPATLPLFATGLGALGLLGWRRKKKAAA